MENRNPTFATKNQIEVLKAIIEFEMIDKYLTKEQLQEKIMQHIFETLEEWQKGNATITIEFKTNENETHEQDHIYIH